MCPSLCLAKQNIEVYLLGHEHLKHMCLRISNTDSYVHSHTQLTEVGIRETAVGEYSLFAFTCSCGSAEGKWDLIQRESVVPALQAVVPIPSFWFLF